MKHSTKTPSAGSKNSSRSRAPAAENDRQDDLLATLGLRVKMLSIAQIARTWWNTDPAPVTACRRWLRGSVRSGLIEMFAMMAHGEIEMHEPLTVWQPGLEAPNFGSVAYRAKARWTGGPKRTELVTATERGASGCGGVGGHRPRLSEVTHDLHLAAVYLRMRAELPTRARSWLSDSAMAARCADGGLSLRGQKQPDAMVRDGRGRTAIEFVGDYTPKKLAAFHEHCARRGWGYELW